MSIPRDPLFGPIAVATLVELQAVARQRRAFVFFSVAWSPDSKQSEIDVVATANAWQRAHPTQTAPLFRIDLAKQDGELWDAVEVWLRRENRSPNLMVGGYGPVLWVCNGRIVDYVDNAHYVGQESLSEKTFVAFQSV